ncbi:SDR family oxidoreductase [Sphingomonas japonica]|uniref:NAD(P)-dependent dehydrogenase (Short-subunit alcohol dehydrogenase family) n=1 Tax=Sphingomonas japonica TaxID=511662 RepID=A0ABX0TYY7_9SPHN|nr:SDR family oxidoreductase [Sphingomonas japonica]NIJ23525.1 NAD(P)-dependent dehydrogenase (short-subunit alcohol dehydrogenase family) [Sphingomonas japonica]
MAKAIFVTGGASGIGLAAAKRFAAEGWRVGLADVNAAALGAVRGQIEGASVYVMDVRDRAAWTRELTAFAGGDGIDVVFNNAGIASGGPFVDTPDDEIDRVVAINFMGVVNGARAAYPFLKQRPSACLLNTASAAGIYGTSGAAIYSATKFAVRGLTEALDGEWRADGIKVRSLMPSFIETPLLDASVTGSNQNVRQRVLAAGLELTPVDTVADAAWGAVHGDAVHTVVGKTARRLKFAARWMPGSLRRQMGRRF